MTEPLQARLAKPFRRFALTLVRQVALPLASFVGLVVSSSFPAPLLGAEPPSKPELIAHWPLTADGQDAAGENHGRARGVAFEPASSDDSQTVANFDGRDDLITVPAHPSLRLGSSEFSISVWVRASDSGDDSLGDIISHRDPKTQRGFSLGWLSNNVTTSQANHGQLYFAIHNGDSTPTWKDRGRPGQAILPFALCTHESEFFAGTCEAGANERGHVYRYLGNEAWDDEGALDASNSVTNFASHEGKLYAGTSKYRLAGSALVESENTNLGGKVYRRDAPGRWTLCGQLPGVEAIGGLIEFRGKLYASSLYRPAGFFRYEGGEAWTALAVPNGKRVEALCAFDGLLYASGYDEGHVYTFDGETWSDLGPLGENTQTYSFAVHQGRLFAGTWPSGRVYRREEDQWIDTGRLGEELETMGMAVYNGQLYCGTLPMAQVHRFDGDGNWVLAGRVDHTPNVKYRRAWTMALFQGKLFVGALPSGHVHSLSVGRCATIDFDARAGWRHLVAVKSRDRLIMYLDGRKAGESESFEPGTFDLDSAAPWTIGFGPQDYLHGALRDLRIYRGILDENAILGLFRP